MNCRSRRQPPAARGRARRASLACDRCKQGFGVPVYEWFLEGLGDRARRDIQDFADGTDLIDVQQVERLFERQRGSDLWVLLNVALWWKRFIRR